MGNVTVSTPDCDIYYPSDFLVDGGPPHEVMNCPDAKFDVELDELIGLVLIADPESSRWQVIDNGKVVMSAEQPRDVANYLTAYMHKVNDWFKEQDDK